MTQTGFLAAMAAELTFGDYDSPTMVGTAETEWIIVSTWGGNAEFLTLARTSVRVLDQGGAPPGLQPRATYLGILLSRSVEADAEISEFLLMRNRPGEVPVGGTFHPSDGYVRIERKGQAISLTGHGRYAHTSGIWQGQTIIRDVPDPAPGSALAQSWHMTAERRPWIGEFTSADPVLRPLARGRMAPHTGRKRKPGVPHGIAAYA